MKSLLTLLATKVIKLLVGAVSLKKLALADSASVPFNFNLFVNPMDVCHTVQPTVPVRAFKSTNVGACVNP